jgi:putative transposase
MPRQPRIDLPGIAQHIVQRGNDRQPCFFNDIDYRRYLQELRELCLQHHCQLHAWVLMTNHVHLLLTPAHSGATSQLMQCLGRRYVRYINDSYFRTGTLWEGRYKACLVGDDDYLLTCMRYIELNPVRAGMVANPVGYPWSSYHATGYGKDLHLLQPHASWLGIDRDHCRRHQLWREFVLEGKAANTTDPVRLCLQRQHPYGSDRFRAAIEVQLGRRCGPAKIGRPKKQRPE